MSQASYSDLIYFILHILRKTKISYFQKVAYKHNLLQIKLKRIKIPLNVLNSVA